MLGAQTSATVLIADNEVVDTTKPTPTVTKAATQDDPTNGSPIVFDVDFGEPVTGFDAGDVVLGTPPTGATLTPTVSGGPDVYQVSVAVTGATADGPIQASVGVDAATDASGNTSNASNQASVAFDVTAPTVQIARAATQESPTNDTTIVFTVTFSACAGQVARARAAATSVLDIMSFSSSRRGSKSEVVVFPGRPPPRWAAWDCRAAHERGHWRPQPAFAGSRTTQ